LGLRQHRQLIPAKAPLGEYIADVVLVVHEIWFRNLQADFGISCTRK
jgi:hypothetical protein